MNVSIKIDHVAVMVNDLEKSLHFLSRTYSDWRLSPLKSTTTGQFPKWLRYPRYTCANIGCGAPDGIHGHTRNEGPGFTLDLIQWLNPPSPVQRYPINHVPSAHICFGVEDVPATYERLKAAGVEFCLTAGPFYG